MRSRLWSLLSAVAGCDATGLDSCPLEWVTVGSSVGSIVVSIVAIAAGSAISAAARPASPGATATLYETSVSKAVCDASRLRASVNLGETGPLSQGVQAGRKALRIRHINSMEVRKKRPRGFKKWSRGFK